jgi:sulfoxide reductase heme-binding subunit YedZ
MPYLNAVAESVLAQAAVPVSDGDVGVKMMAQLSARLAYFFMCVTLWWGVFTATGWVARITGRNGLQNLHMILATFTIAFGALHSSAFLLLENGGWTLARVLLPYHPTGRLRWSLGIVGFEVMVAIFLSVGVQKYTSYKSWLRLHKAAYLAIGLTVVHALFGAIANGNLALLWIGGMTLLTPTVIITVLRFIPARVLTKIGVLEEAQ